MDTRLFIPDTLNYMIAGYVVISVMLFGYIGSLILRWRKAVKVYKEYQKD